jgi:hypothetical protein
VKKANSENHTYETVEIDSTTGLFKRTEVNQNETFIRVNSGIFGEEFNKGKTYKLTGPQVKELETQFNAVRAERDWAPVEFRTTKEISKIEKNALPDEVKFLVEDNNEMSSAPEVQG